MQMTNDEVSAQELRQMIERFEQLSAEKQDIADQQKELMAELKGRGYDSKAFKEVIRLRKMKPDQRAEFEAVVDLYRQAAGLA
jgi:uncharacterized protein (UPF0335 family)